MKKATNIHNLDTLEREIYRLQLDAKKMERQFDENFDHLQHNYSSMFMNSIFRKKKRDEEGSGLFDAFVGNENLHNAFNRISDRVADKIAEEIEKFIDKILHKEK